jgi:hypothetical protein
MKGIDEFLAKFKLIEDPKKDKIKFLATLNSFLGMNISEESVTVKGNLVTIALEPALKSYLFTNKESFLKEIEKATQQANIRILFK